MNDFVKRRTRNVCEEIVQHIDGFDNHPRFSHASWVAVAVGGSALIGAGVSMYGANKQAKSNSAAQDQNIAQQNKQNDAAWTNWLMTRGVAPTSPITAGQMPSSYAAVNTRLPLWASINQPTGPSRWQKVGANYGKPNTLAVTAPIGGAAATTPIGTDGTASTGAPQGNKTANAALNVLDPSGLTSTLAGTGGPRTVGTVAKNLIDPLGIFCWVAREVYGEDNPRWMQFRDWLLTKAPVELRDAYWLNGPTLAARIRKSQTLREQVRAVMDGIFASEIEVRHA